MLDRKADEWIVLLTACDLDDVDGLEDIVSRIPPALLHRVGKRGGPAIREKLYAPALRWAECRGIVEWTGEYDPNGLKIWRSLVGEAHPIAAARPVEGR